MNEKDKKQLDLEVSSLVHPDAPKVLDVLNQIGENFKSDPELTAHIGFALAAEIVKCAYDDEPFKSAAIEEKMQAALNSMEVMMKLWFGVDVKEVAKRSVSDKSPH